MTTQVDPNEVAEIRAIEGFAGPEFIVIYKGQVEAQKISFSPEEYKRWDIQPRAFCELLWKKMYDEGKTLHEGLREVENELGSEDYKVEKLFESFRLEEDGKAKHNQEHNQGKVLDVPKKKATAPRKKADKRES